MPGEKLSIDSRPNLAAIQATESAANTLTYAQFAFPFSIMDKVALVIHRVEYFPNLALLVGQADSTLVGVIAAKAIDDPTDQSDPVLLDSVQFARYDGGTAATFVLDRKPFVKDFSSLPGGGILVAPNPLTVFIKSLSLASANSAWVRMYYTYMKLTTEEYWQLVESRRVVSNA